MYGFGLVLYHTQKKEPVARRPPATTLTLHLSDNRQLRSLKAKQTLGKMSSSPSYSNEEALSQQGAVDRCGIKPFCAYYSTLHHILKYPNTISPPSLVLAGKTKLLHLHMNTHRITSELLAVDAGASTRLAFTK